MLNRIKKLVYLAVLGLCPLIVFGQNNTNSPFSMYGVGDLFSGGYGRSSSMGGVGAGLYSMHYLNPSNPATYAALTPSTFVFEVGLATTYYTSKTANNSFSNFDGNIRTIAMGFPVTKWWKVGIGISPVSSIGYNIQKIHSLPNDTNIVQSIYKGEGGINSFYFDNSFQIFKSFSIGAKVSYLFGSLDRIRNIQSYNLQSTTTYFEANRWVINAFSYGLGAHFHKSISPNLYINIGATYNFNTDLAAEFDKFATLSVYKYQRNFVDTLFSGVNKESTISIPQSFSIGTSIMLKNKLELAFDYQQDNWSQTKFEDQNLSNNQRFGLGMEYVPDMGSSVYLKFVRYRAGFNYTKSYLNYDNEQLQEIGGSLGLGLPLKSGAIVNVGFLYNRRTVPGKDILSENFYQLNLNFSFKANWFIKTRFF
jgi:hypothetical protein